MGIIRKNANEFDLSNEFYINFVSLKKSEEQHTHNFIEIVYTLDGKGIHYVDGQEYIVGGGDVLVINYHHSHAITPVENFRYFDIMLKPEFINDTLRGTDDIFLFLRLSDFTDISSSVNRDNLLLHFDGDERRRIDFLIEWVREEQVMSEPANGIILHSAVSMLLSIIFRKMSEDQAMRLAVNKHLLSYVRHNCANRLLIHEIASRCGYTPEHFSRMFKKYTGKTPISYIIECRIDKARELLLTTDRAIEEIVFECGFSNRTEFFKKFHEYVGVTPLQFRKNQI